MMNGNRTGTADKKWKKAFEFLWDFVYPENIYCIACGKPMKKGDSSGLCVSCMREILYKQPAQCRRCGRFSSIGGSVSFCEYCSAVSPVYDAGTAAVVYDGNVRKIIHGLKYGGKGYLAKNIAWMIFQEVNKQANYDIIVPVPMFKSKLKLRGYCQTTLISEQLAVFSGKPVSKGNLVRVSDTVPMSGLSPEQRRDNIRGAFRVNAPDEFRGRRLLLVDDLLTTGSTANECAAVLKECGAEYVHAAVFASPLRNYIYS